MSPVISLAVFVITTAPCYAKNMNAKVKETSSSGTIYSSEGTGTLSEPDIFLLYIWSQGFQIRYFNKSGISSQIA